MTISLSLALSTFVQFFFGLLEWAIFLQVLYSWIRPRSGSWLHRTVLSIVIPIYRFVVRIIPPFGPLDFTPFFSLILLEAAGYFLIQLIGRLPG